MSSHPKDSQPPEDNNSDVQNLSDEDGFMVLDDTHASEQTHPADDEEFWDLDDEDESPEVSAVTKTEPTENGAKKKEDKIESIHDNEAKANNDFWDLNNQYNEIPFGEATEEIEEKLTTPPQEQISKTSESSVPKEPETQKTDNITEKSIVSTTFVATTSKTTPQAKSEQEKEVKEQNDKISNSPATEETKNKSRITPIEIISSIICYIGIIALFAYLVDYASKQHNFDTDPPFTTDIPASGEFASIASVETWWEKPEIGKAQYGTILVPVAKITLAEDSKSGAIRSIFFNPQNEYLNREATRKGDAISSEFRNGKFLESGTNELTVYATDGYEEEAHFNFYCSQNEERWTIEIRESKENKATTNEFKYLAKAPIEPIRK